MANVYDVLKERGLIAQVTHEDKVRELLGNESVTFYIGFDPTGDSLHIGHFMQMIIMKHMQNAGHKPIALVGGGTAMVPDPTGKDDMRKILTVDEIRYNAECLKKQMSKFLDFSDAVMVNNADWLLPLNYIEFLREVGMHFSVNRMLGAECFKSRMERGLSFIEFNYMLMQGYDFYVLNQDYNCRLQLGGDDQWSNILGGVELIRRKSGKEVYGMTFTLLTNSEGKKMGKTEKGALWIDPERTAPYEFYQYWRNVADVDVVRFLKLMTFIPMDEIKKYESLQGQELNDVKTRLAYEVTKIVHGEANADAAKAAAMGVFGGGNNEDMPKVEIEHKLVESGINIMDLLHHAKLIPSKGEGRRLTEQGGLSINGEKLTDIGMVVNTDYFPGNEMIVKKGKKVYLKLVIV